MGRSKIPEGPNILLTKARQGRGWSQKRLAEQIQADPSMVSRWERGERSTDYIYQEKLCDLFRKNAVELGFVKETNEDILESSSKREAMRKIGSFVGATILTTSNDLLSPPLWERLSRTISKSSSVDAQALEGLEQISTNYWQLRASIGYRNLLKGFIGHLETVTELLRGSHPPLVHKRLSIIASKIAQRLGAIYFDMNDYETANAYYEVSIEAAQEAEDYTLWATGLGRMGSLPIYNEYPQGALPLLQEAQKIAKTHCTPTISAWLLSVEAEAYANLQNEKACLNSLKESEVYLSRIKQDDLNEIKFDYTRFIGYKGTCYLQLNRPKEALTALKESFTESDTLSPRQKSIIFSDIAEALRQQEQIEEACKFGLQALEITDQIKSSLVQERLNKVVQEMKPWKSLNAVKELEHQIKFRTQPSLVRSNK